MWLGASPSAQVPVYATALHCLFFAPPNPLVVDVKTTGGTTKQTHEETIIKYNAPLPNIFTLEEIRKLFYWVGPQAVVLPQLAEQEQEGNLE